jgi:hypothetical protein
VASANSAHALVWRERDADADVRGNADLALYRAKAGGRNADIEEASLRATGSKENCPWRYQRQGDTYDPASEKQCPSLAVAQ